MNNNDTIETLPVEQTCFVSRSCRVTPKPALAFKYLNGALSRLPRR